jgi:hypothetical protein
MRGGERCNAGQEKAQRPYAIGLISFLLSDKAVHVSIQVSSLDAKQELHTASTTVRF